MSDNIPTNYELVSPEVFTSEQKQFVENFKDSISLISSQTDIILGAKDIHSRHFLSTDSYAHLVELPKGGDVTGRFDRDMPCDGTVQFAQCYVDEDYALLTQGDIDKKISVLNIHIYSQGIKALVFDKHILKHQPSYAILGTIYSAREIEISNFFTLIPNYVLEFGTECSIESIQGALDIDNIKFTEYEHEVCFLLMMNWECKDIAEFMNRYRPKVQKRTVDTIYKCRNRICEKLGIYSYNFPQLKDKLVHLGIHRKMPESFFKRLLGSKLIH
ncbi:MAG: hypothetical protein K0R08_1659 [Solimicrobium sp.]|jgi:hypothetical protein|nr:hypothetical protein [Solimicrobium sp.]